MKPVITDKAPAPGGHYSQGMIHNGLLYVSGQLAVNPETGEKVLGSIEWEMKQVLKNVKAVLNAAGTDMNHVIKTTVYVSDISLWGQVNAIYSDFFGDHKPARAVVPAGELHYGFRIEMEAIAAINSSNGKK